MPEQISILVFPAEGENAFELYKALRYAVRLKVFGASSRKVAGHGQFVFDRYDATLPLINEPDFLEHFTKYLTLHGIKYIFPTHDTVAAFLKTHEASLPARVMGPSADTAVTCRKKTLTYAAFHDAGFCPVVYEASEQPPAFPVFLKPDQGQGGQGCHIIDNMESLHAALMQTPDAIITEYLPGKEFTVDCFTDRHGKLLFIGPRSRDVVKLGMAYVSSTVALTQEIEQIASAINVTFPMRGLWFFQVKEDVKKRLKLLEVAVRASCGMGLYRQLGVNLPLLSVYDALGMDVSVLRNPGGMNVSRNLQSRYYPQPDFNTVYVDYDDTLCVHGKVNTTLLAFLYQCLNDGKHLVLISKHDGDLRTELEKRRIALNLFDAILHLDPKALKYPFMKDRNAIFIDNLFHERAEVLRECGFPVYDTDAVECLLHQGRD